MKKITKLITLLLVFAMIAGCFAACNTANGGTDTETSDATSDTVAESTETESEKASETEADSTTETVSETETTTEATSETEVESETVSETESEKETETESETEPETESVQETTEAKTEQTTEEETTVFVDYAAQVKFNKNSGRIYAEVKVHEERYGDRVTYGFVDGDTTHFDVPASVANVIGDSVLKARYIAINTPESTGEVEPWGKKASNYTRAALEDAVSIIIESDTASWNADSSGGRYVVWIWYKTAEMTDYRNLNIEILQQGLAYASNTGGNSYGDVAMAALNQAKKMKLHVFSTEPDPDYYYGGAYNLSLKELKTNTEVYKDKLVRFEGVITKRAGNTIYMEEYDAETNMFYGIQIFCGYSIPGSIMKYLIAGNRVSMVGTLQYYANGGYYQVSNVQYNIMKPNSPEYVHKISEGHEAGYQEVNPDIILDGTIDIDSIIEDEEGNVTTETKTFTYGELALFSTVSVKGLKVLSTYTTKEGDHAGAISITCETASGKQIVVRTEVLRDADGNTVKESIFEIGSYIDVKGIIDFYQNSYQVKVFDIADVTFN